MIPQIPRRSPAFRRLGERRFPSGFMAFAIMIPQIPHFCGQQWKVVVDSPQEDMWRKSGGSAGSCRHSPLKTLIPQPHTRREIFGGTGGRS